MKKRVLWAGAIICIFSIGWLLIFPKWIKRSQISSKVKQEVRKELGSEITLQDFLTEEASNVSVDVDLTSLNQVGEYKVKVTIENETLESKVKIEDTTSPIIHGKNLTMYIDEDVPKALDFIEKIEEQSNYTVKDITVQKQLGTQEIVIEVEDQYQNKSSVAVSLTIIEDKDPPKLDGLTPITIELGEQVDLEEGVTAFDKRFGLVSFRIDASEVNYQKPGKYSIYYEAEDPLKNQIRETRTIEIKPKERTYKIDNFPTFHQYPKYPNGCESVALYNLLRYYNVNVTIDEIVNTLKKGEKVHFEHNVLYGGNPEIEFVGDPRDIHGYGVFQKPIIDVANQYKKGIIDYTGHSFDEVLELVKKKIPVQIWCLISL